MMWDRVKIVLTSDIRKMTPAETAIHGVFLYVAGIAGFLCFVFIDAAFFDPDGFGEDIRDGGLAVLWVLFIFLGIGVYHSYLAARRLQATGREPGKPRRSVQAAVRVGLAVVAASYCVSLLIDYLGLSSYTLGVNIVVAVIAGVVGTAVYAAVSPRWRASRDEGDHESGAPTTD